MFWYEPFTVTRGEDALTNCSSNSESLIVRGTLRNIHRSGIPGWWRLIPAVSSSLVPALQTHTPGIWVCWRPSIHPGAKERKVPSGQRFRICTFSIFCVYLHTTNSEGRKTPVDTRVNDIFLTDSFLCLFHFVSKVAHYKLLMFSS